MTISSKPNHQREFSNYCDNVVELHCFYDKWASTGIDLSDLADDEKQELTHLCSLARFNRRDEIELICEGDYVDELIPMLQTYLKDNTRADELAQLLAKQAFSACDNRIKEQLEISLAEYRKEMGFVSDYEDARRLDNSTRYSEHQSYR